MVNTNLTIKNISKKKNQKWTQNKIFHSIWLDFLLKELMKCGKKQLVETIFYKDCYVARLILRKKPLIYIFFFILEKLITAFNVVTYKQKGRRKNRKLRQKVLLLNYWKQRQIIIKRLAKSILKGKKKTLQTAFLLEVARINKDKSIIQKYNKHILQTLVTQETFINFRW